jgi:hypothetical protein
MTPSPLHHDVSDEEVRSFPDSLKVKQGNIDGCLVQIATYFHSRRVHLTHRLKTMKTIGMLRAFLVSNATCLHHLQKAFCQHQMAPRAPHFFAELEYLEEDYKIPYLT